MVTQPGEYMNVLCSGPVGLLLIMLTMDISQRSLSVNRVKSKSESNPSQMSESLFNQWSLQQVGNLSEHARAK